MRISFLILLSVLLLSACDLFDNDDDAAPTSSNTSVVSLSPAPSPVQGGDTVHLHADITNADAIEWVQVGGTPVVNLADQTTANPVFTAPTVTSRETLQFELRVTTAGTTTTFPLQLDVTPAGLAVDAGKDQLVSHGDGTGTQVTLHASSGSDSGNPVALQWTQISGPAMTITGGNTANPVVDVLVAYETPQPGSLGSFIGNLIFEVEGTEGGRTSRDRVEIKVMPPVIAAITTPLSVNAGLDQVVSINHRVHLNAVAGGGTTSVAGAPGYTYLWTKTSGPAVTLNNSTTFNPDFTPTQAGRYVFEVEATDDNPDTATDSVVIDVKNALLVNPGTTSALSAGQKLSLHPQVTGGSGTFSYQWSADKTITYINGSATSRNPVVTYNPPVGEVVTLTLTVTDNGVAPAVSESASYQVFFLASTGVTQVDAGEDKTVFPGDRVSLHALATPEKGVAYSWQAPPRITFTDGDKTNNPTFTAPATPGTYVFTVTANTLSTSTRDTVTITVQAPTITTAGEKQRVTEGDRIYLHGAGAHGSGSYTYQWQVLDPPGSGATFDDANSKNAAFRPAQAGRDYLLQLAVTDSGTNTTLTPSVQIGVPEKLSVDARADKTVKPGDTVTVHAKANKPGVNFQWLEGTPQTGRIHFDSGAATDNATFTAPQTEGQYKIAVAVTKDNAIPDADEVIITVQTPVSTSAGADQTVTKGHLVHLHGSAAHGTGPYTYEWSTINAPETVTFSDATLNNPSFMPNTAGSYELDLQVTDSSATPQIVHGTVTITVIEALTVNAGIDQNVRDGTIVQLRPAISGGIGPFTYAWTLPAGISLEDNTRATDKDIHVTASPLTTQSYTLQLTVTDTGDNNITVSDTVDLTFTVADVTKQADPTKVRCNLSPEQCANIANGAPTGQRMVFGGTGTVKFPTGDYEPIPSRLETGSDCGISTGRNAPSDATFSAFGCGTGKSGELISQVCERLGESRPAQSCAPGELPYSRLINHGSGARELELGCMSRQQCTQVVPGLQPRAATDPNKALNDKCLTSDPKFVKTEDYECTFCCVGDACNYQSAGCYVQPGTLWTIP